MIGLRSGALLVPGWRVCRAGSRSTGPGRRCGTRLFYRRIQSVRVRSADTPALHSELGLPKPLNGIVQGWKIRNIEDRSWVRTFRRTHQEADRTGAASRRRSYGRKLV